MELVGKAAKATLPLLFSGWVIGVLPAEAHGPIDEQVATLSEQIQQDPQNAVLYLKRGALHSHHDDWTAALADYERAARLDPTLDVVDLARGRTLLAAGGYPQAKSTLDRFLAKHPHHGEALATRARVLVKLSQPLAAAEDYTHAIAAGEGLDRPEPDYYVERARALAGARGDHVDEGLRGLDEGIKRLGPIVTLQLEAINLELARKQYEAALARLAAIAAQSPRKEAWMARRGEILEQAGRVGESRLAYEEAVAAIGLLPPRHRMTRATTGLEAQIRAALARLAGGEHKEAEP